MQNVTMTRPLDTTKWPITVSQAVFSKAEIVQSSPFPAGVNILKVTLAASTNIAASCRTKITIANLQGACFTSVAVGDTQGVVNIDGADSARFADSEATALASSGNSKAIWDVTQEQLTFYVAGAGLVADQDNAIEFQIKNPPSAQPSPNVTIQATGIPLPRITMAKNPRRITLANIFAATIAEAEPLQIRSLSTATAFITKTIGQSSAEPGQANTLTMTLKMNLPLTASGPTTIITISGLLGANAPRGSIAVNATKDGATSNAFSGEWHNGEKRLLLTVVQSTQPGADYVISFQITNAKQQQSSPPVSIETSGIVIHPVTMDSANGTLTQVKDSGVGESTIAGARAPLLILPPRFIKRYVHQTGGSNWPGQSNELHFKFTPTVSFKPVEGGRAAITISGLIGVDRTSGPVWLSGNDAGKFTDCRRLITNQSSTSECTPGKGSWNADTKKLILNVYSELSSLQELSFSFNFTNSIVGQDPPVIELGMATDTQAAIQGLALTEYNWTQQAVGDASVSTTVMDSYFVSQMTEVAERNVAGLLDKDSLQNGSFTTKTDGLGLRYEGILVIETAGEYTFGVTGDDSVDIAVDGSVVASRENPSWDVNAATGTNDISRTVMLSVGPHSFAARCVQDQGSLGVQAYWKTPLNPSTFAAIPDSAFRVPFQTLYIDPVNFNSTADVAGTDNVALLIYRSAGFTVKDISQSTSSPGATNTITVSFKPQFSLTGARNSTITISGLLGSMTPDSTLTLLDSGALFNTTARWVAQTGSLTLAVASGQTVPSTSVTVIKFDLENPTVAQDAPSMIFISAEGDVPISASAMSLGSGNDAPLKVVPASWTSAVISQSSSVPGALNTITVTAHPGVILSRSRNSAITVYGIQGTATESTDALAVNVTSGNAVAFSSPAVTGITISFSSTCKLEDDKVQLSDEADGTNFTGSILYFNRPESGPLNCSDRWTRIASYNVSTRCATLTVTDGAWSDGSSKCSDLGFVHRLELVAGGQGYTSGALVVDGATGTGLAGTCNVDNSSGTILSVSLSNGGSGYNLDTNLSCPSACTSSRCGVSTGNGAQGGRVALSIPQRSVTVAAGQWDQFTGTLVLGVHKDLTGPIVFSFDVRNSLTPQGQQDVWLMAGGEAPIGSVKMTGSVLQIDGANSSQTATCACTPASSATACTCNTNVTGLPTNRALYALKAEVQCNSATNVDVKVSGVSVSTDVVMQPSTVCKDACNTYHTLFEWHNVASSVTSEGTLPLSADASGVGVDYCGAGDNLKVLFTLYY